MTSETFNRVRNLGLEMRRARQASSAWYSLNSDRPYEPENEGYIRAEVQKERLIKNVIAAEDAYRAACDTYFLSDDASDVVEALHEAAEALERYSDADHNGHDFVPNAAMSALQTVRAALAKAGA